MERSDERGGKPRQQEQERQQGSEQQSQQGPTGDKQHGEGNYKATRDYNRGVKEHMQSHDVEREARDAAPRSEDKTPKIKHTKNLGKKKAQGMQDPKDRMDGSGRDADGGKPR